MIEQDIKWVPVDGSSSELGYMQEAATMVEEWLAESPGSKDKPIDEILDPEYRGVFIFPDDGDGNPDFTQPPLAYVAQRAISPPNQVWNPNHFDSHLTTTPALHEISSLIVNPDWQGNGLGYKLINEYKDYLIEQFGDGIDLVAIAHQNGSSSVFEKAGFQPVHSLVFTQTVEIDTETLDRQQDLQRRITDGQLAGKVLMAYGASIN